MIWIKSFISLATQVFLKSNAGLGFIYNLKKSQKMIRSKPNQESNMDQREEDLLKKVLLSHDCKKKRDLGTTNIPTTILNYLYFEGKF